nr:glycosyltransferase [Polynucleobacter sp. JS-Fieb-80-E5]
MHGWDSQYSAAYDYAFNLSAIGTLTKLGRPNPKLLGADSPIKHIPKILYHQRVRLIVNPKSKQVLEIGPSKPDEKRQSEQGLALLKRFFKSQQRKVAVKQIKPKLYRHHWTIPKPEPLVSLIIPTKDGYDILKTCVQSILKKTTYKNYEILIVDNQSTDPQTIQYMNKLESAYPDIRILKYNKPFNYSAINNYAVTQAKGSILGLINNDTEVITPDWLTEMVSHAIRPEIGCVGAMLYYPDMIIQHAGVHVDINGHLSHIFNGLTNKPINDHFYYMHSITNPMAVTGAALLIKKNLFWKVNGLDEKNLKIAFNDIDLCLKSSSTLRSNIQLAHIELRHHESKSRALEGPSGKYMQNAKEFNYFKRKWAKIFKYTSNLVYTHNTQKDSPGLIGSIDQVNANLITGWAHDPTKTNKKTEIIIKVNGKKISTLEADIFREDLRELKINNGLAGFNFSASNKIFNDGDFISAELKISGRQLANSPWKFTIDPSTIKWLNRLKRTTPRILERLNCFYRKKFIGETISIIMPAYNSNPKWFEEAIMSVKKQWSPNWELIIVDDYSQNKTHLKSILELIEIDPRIKLINSCTNKGIAATINIGIEEARGEYITFMDHDDVLEPDAVIHLLQAARKKPDLIYSDEIITGSNVEDIIQYAARPSFSYDYYLSHPYFVHMIAVKKNIAKNVGGWNESMKISADVDFVLKVLATSKLVAHIPSFLYRWRTHQTSHGHSNIKMVEQATSEALNRHLHEIGISAKIKKGSSFNTFNIQYPKATGDILIIIPTKDQVDLLKKCIRSILNTQNLSELKIVVINHESKDINTLAYLDSIKDVAEIMNYKGEFNFSKMNNIAVRKFSKGCKYVLFLNNDIEALTRGWLDSLKSLCSRNDVGAAGAQLLYPNNTIQHSGVIIGMNGLAEHAHKFQHFRSTKNQINPGYLGSLVCTRDYSAVTGACLMMKIETFLKVAGFDEKFEIGFNDIDLCLRIRDLGLKILLTQNATLIHHESLTRKTHSKMHHPSDSRRFQSRWESLLKSGDYFYNPQLNLLEDHKINEKIVSTKKLRLTLIEPPSLSY